MNKLSRRGFIINCIKEGKYTENEILLKVKQKVKQKDYSTTHEMALTSIISEMKRNATLTKKPYDILSFNEKEKVIIATKNRTKIQGKRRDTIIKLIKDGRYGKSEILKIINDEIDPSLYRSKHEQALNNVIKQYKEAGVLIEKENGIIGYLAK
jgi:hypothetical protein